MPSNVLVASGGAEGQPQAKLIDFGIARAVDDLQMTQTGMIVGTAHYIAPEQAAGQPVTPSADLYAVGVVLFEMLTGRLPFEGDQPVAIALQHVNDDPPAVSIVNPTVPRDLEDVVMRALAKSPEQWFADAEEFIGALQTVRQRILSGAPVPPPGATVGAAVVAPRLPLSGISRERPPPSAIRTRAPGWKTTSAPCTIAARSTASSSRPRWPGPA